MYRSTAFTVAHRGYCCAAFFFVAIENVLLMPVICRV